MISDVPLWICFLCFVISWALLFMPYSRRELKLWKLLEIRRLRLWATKHKTEKIHEQGAEPAAIVKKSNKNIIIHSLLTFVFASLILQAKGYDVLYFKLLAALLVIPSIFYLAGSVIQRQKIAICLAREKNLVAKKFHCE